MTQAPSEFRTKRYVGAKGIQLVGDVGGDPSASPILLLHGGGQTRHSWSNAMRKLVAGGYYVVNLDARGHGTATGHPTVTTLLTSSQGTWSVALGRYPLNRR
jgi:alpha-beta hydrolase superfamily lysophospholipase